MSRARVRRSVGALVVLGVVTLPALGPSASAATGAPPTTTARPAAPAPSTTSPPSPSTSGTTTTTTSPPAATTTTTPPETLAVGDQDGLLQALFATDDGLATAPYTVQWRTEPSAPSLLSDASSGAVEVGLVDNVSLLFAQEARQPVVAVAVAEPPGGAGANCSVVVPASSSVAQMKDLDGRTVAITTGSVGEYLVASGLGRAGVPYGAVHADAVTPAAALAALRADTVDAAVLGQPQLASALAGGKARQLSSGGTAAGAVDYVVATNGVLSSALGRAVVADFAERVVAAEAASARHPNPLAANWAADDGLPLTVAQAALGKAQTKRRPAPTGRFTSALETAQADEAQALFQAGLLAHQLRTAAEFDLALNRTLKPVPA